MDGPLEPLGRLLPAERVKTPSFNISSKAIHRLTIHFRDASKEGREELYRTIRLADKELRYIGVELEFDSLEQDWMIDLSVGLVPPQPPIAKHELDSLAFELDPAAQFE